MLQKNLDYIKNECDACAKLIKQDYEKYIDSYHNLPEQIQEVRFIKESFEYVCEKVEEILKKVELEQSILKTILSTAKVSEVKVIESYTETIYQYGLFNAWYKYGNDEINKWINAQ